MTEEQVFLAALDLPDHAARIAYLEEVCAENGELRRQVEELLAVHTRTGQFLDQPAADQIAAGTQPPKDQTVALNAEGADAMADNKKNSPSSSDDESDDLQFLSPSSRPDSLGRLGHYEMLQVLGRGGFGIVFRAFDDILQRVVALKVMAPQIATLSPARKRFLREARSSAAVRHENVVHVYEVGEQPLPYLVMEFVPGETLQQKLDRCGPLDVPETLRIGRQVAEGLSAAHACDLIHRDIKPGNILLEGGSHKAKITDFGLARAADDASISQSGIVAGTPMFMAPEQALGQHIDQRADLFSLGSVLYQMASGRPPFRAPTALAVLKRVAEESPRPIAEIIPETPDWLCGIIAKLHAKDPKDRFQSAREVADLLADCEAKLKAKQEVKNVLPAATRGEGRGARGGKKWVAAAAVLLLPVIALAVTEFVGVTHLFRQQAAPDPIEPGSVPAVPAHVAAPFAKAGGGAVLPELPPTFKNSIGMEFVIVPKGKSWLGGGKDKLGDQEVEIPADFYLGKYEVTQEEWEKVMGENPSHFSRTGDGMDAVKDIPDADLKRFPVETVSWDQCQVFVAKLNKLEKETGWVYRLPKEAEWEYACRGGPMSDKADSAFDFYFAKPTNTLLPEQANFKNDKGLNRTCKVGSYEPNRLGLFDMHGNVHELCDDTETGADEISRRVTQGGSWANIGMGCRAANRITHGLSARGDGLGLRVARLPSGAPSPEAKTPPPAVADPDRRAAEYVLSIGGTVRINGADREIRAVADLPRGAFRLTFVHLNGNKQVTDAGLAAFDNCTNVTELHLVGCKQVTDAGLAHFKDCKALADLRLSSTRLTDAGLANFKDCKKLTNLELHFTNVSDEGLRTLKDCKSLKSIFLEGTHVTDAGLAHLKNCNDLRQLDVPGLPITDTGLAHLKECKYLTLINLNETQVGDAGLEHLKDCKQLVSLSLIGTQVSGAGFIHLKDCKDLANLWLAGTKVNSPGLAHLKGMPLKLLWIQNADVTDLTPLQGMPLEDMRLTPKNITKGLDILRAMKSLKAIGIREEQYWPAAEFWERYDKGEFK